MKVIIALKPSGQITREDCDYIGADKGALILAQNGIHMRCAIGDFDSVEEKDMDLIRAYSDETIVLNPIKDDSDSQAAIEKAVELGYDTIELIGALGGRIDHEYVNLRLVYRYPERLVIKDERNIIMALKPGCHVIKRNDYKYLSFFTESEEILTLRGFAYPLEKRKITYRDVYTVSNELSEEEGVVINEKNPVLLIRSRD